MINCPDIFLYNRRAPLLGVHGVLTWICCLYESGWWFCGSQSSRSRSFFMCGCPLLNKLFFFIIIIVGVANALVDPPPLSLLVATALPEEEEPRRSSLRGAHKNLHFNTSGWNVSLSTSKKSREGPGWNANDPLFNEILPAAKRCQRHRKRHTEKPDRKASKHNQHSLFDCSYQRAAILFSSLSAIVAPSIMFLLIQELFTISPLSSRHSSRHSSRYSRLEASFESHHQSLIRSHQAPARGY